MYFKKLRISIKLDTKKLRLSIKLQQGFPLWFRKIHICRAPRLFYMFFAVLKPFLGEEFRVKNQN